MLILPSIFVSPGGEGGEVQIHPEYAGLSACQIRYSHLCHGCRGRPVGSSAGGRHLDLPADAGTDDRLRYGSDAERCREDVRFKDANNFLT